jgi:cytoskeletal protein CcmA (bactofilin family)
LSAIPDGAYFDYDNPTQVLGSALNYPNFPGYTYKVKGDNIGDGQYAILTASAEHAASGTKKVILAYVSRGSYGMGTVHLGGEADTIETNFDGEAFTINGTDRCGQEPEISAISVTDPDLKDEIIDGGDGSSGLSSGQEDNVTGLGDEPSIIAIGDPSTSVEDLAIALLAEAGVVEEGGGNFVGNKELGTQGSPQITHITGHATIGGNLTGYGVIIVDGNVDIQGNLEFEGIIIARGEVEVRVLGNATVFGSLMLEESNDHDSAIELDIRGNATLQYDSCALATAMGGTGITNPWVPIIRPVKLLGWKENI